MTQDARRKTQGARNYRDLIAFQKADALVLRVYVATANFPTAERFGLTNQIRRAAISTASNIVEGCSRLTDRDFARFLEIAHGSADEVAYQLGLAHRLRFEGLPGDLVQQAEEVSKVLSGLISSLRLASCDLERS